MGAWESGLAGVDCFVQGVAMEGRGGLAGMAARLSGGDLLHSSLMD